MLAQHLTSSSHSPPNHGWPLRARISPQPDRLKRALDLFVTIPLAVLALPVIAAAWLLVRSTSKGPGFYSQIRVGRNGHHYRIYKIRTMHHNCESKSGAAWCTKHDRRVTGVGRVLRKLHIDELPQLLNVLLGDMSLVGPRPERPEFVRLLAEQIPGYVDRLVVRPGVTGLAQIQLPPDVDVEDVRRKIVLDRCYTNNRNLWLDLRIMMGTVIYLLGFSYSAVRRLMVLPNPLACDEPRDESRLHVVVGSYAITRGGSDLEQSFPAGPIPCSEAQ